MRYEDASGSFSAVAGNPDARDDADVLAAGSRGPATGNTITGAGTLTGQAGADLVSDGPGKIVALEGANGSDTSDGGSLQVAGRFGELSMDANGNYRYQPNAETPDGARDVFRYTLADNAGARDAATLTIEIGREEKKVDANAQQIVPGPDGVVILPPGVELSDIQVVGRNLVITLPDGSQMVIIDGAVFVPQLVLNGVEVPATNLAALLIDSEPQPAGGIPQSSGGNFDVPVPPLDPGVPLGDLIPPTVLTYTPPEFHDIGQFIDREPVAGVASAQLDDDAQEGGNPLSNVGDDPGGDTASGFLPGSDGDGALTWALTTSGAAPAGFSYAAQANGDIWVLQGATHVMTISVDPSTGEYTVDQLVALDHPAGGDENNLIFTINYTVTDQDGDTAVGTLTIDVDDDTPSVSVQAGSDANVILTTDDADTIGIASDTAVTAANFSGVFSGTTVTFGADGAGPGTSSTYSLAVTGSNSGLTSHGVTINLFVVGGVVVGTTAGSAGAIDASNTIFTVSTTNTGIVTLTQFQQIDHPIAQDPSATGAPFADQFISMVDGLVTLTRSETAVDGDGDSVTGSATVNIGANLRFTDDGPTIDPTLNEVGGAIVDESAPVETATIPLVGGYTAGDDPHLAGGLAIGRGSTSGAVVDANAAFGADGPATGGGISYALDVLNATSGLTTTEGTAINLVELANGVVVGVVAGTTTVAFAISIDSVTGVVTVEQYLSLFHPDSPDNFDEPVFLNEGSLGVTVTATDFDGDTATSDAVDITSLIRFEDDGPSIDPALNAEATVTVDESLPSTAPAIDTGLIVKGDDPDLAGGFALGQANSGVAIVNANAVFGADGPAAAGSLSYALSITNAASGVTLTDGTAINLQMVNGVIVGVVAAGAFAGQAAFAIAINSTTGVVSVEQYLSLDHPVNPDPNDPLGLGDSTIAVTVTATDGDGDSVTSDAVDISNQITFLDDGPSVDPALNAEATVTVDESLPSTAPAIDTGLIVKGDDPDLAGGFALGQANSGVAIVNANAVFGADGPAAAGSLSYALSITNAASGVTLTDGTAINLQMVNGVIVGVVAAGAFAGQAAFAIAINSTTGVVSVEQYLSLDHPVNPDPNDPLGLGDNTVAVTVTATDGDGDPVTSGAIDISGQITFLDDGPDADPVLEENSTVTVDESLPSAVAAIDTLGVVKGDDPDLAGGLAIGSGNSGAAVIDVNALFGADGPAAGGGIVYALSVLNASSGLTLTDGSAINLQLLANGVVVGVVAAGAFAGQAAFAIAINPTTGVVTVEQYLSLDHPDTTDHNDPLGLGEATLGVTATVTDGDGDSITTDAVDISGQITFLDDGPNAQVDGQAALDTLVLDETTPPGTETDGDSNPAGLVQTTANFADNFVTPVNYGADGPGTTSYSLVLSGSNVASGLYAIDPSDISAGDGDGYGRGAQIVLNQSGNTITGSVGGVDYFTIAINPATGVVTFTQLDNIWHANTGSDDDTSTLMANLGSLLVRQTVTDGDGDTDTADIDVSAGVFQIEDDGPVATNDVDEIAGGGTSATGNVITGVGTNAGAANADDVGADTPGRVTAVSSIAGGTDTTFAGGFLVIDGDHGSLQIDANGNYTYTRDDGAPGNVQDVFTYTLTDADGDSTTATLTINIGDAAPNLPDPALIRLDDDVIPGAGGNLNGPGDDDPDTVPGNVVNGQLIGSGGDGALTYNFTGLNTLPAGFSIGAGSDADTLLINQGATLVMTIQLNQATGAFTVTQNAPILHPADNGGPEDNIENNLLFSIGVEVEDADGDVEPATITINVDDDTPTINVTKGDDSAVILTTDDAQTIGGASDTASSTANFSGVFGLTQSAGADGTAAAATLSYALDVTGFTGGPAGVDSGLNQGGNNIYLYEIGGKVVGSTSATLVGVDAGNTVFDVGVSGTGVVTLTQYSQIDHVGGDPTPTGGPPFADHIVSIADGLITLTASASLTDNDGDTVTDSEVVSIGANLRFTDDGPDAQTSGTAIGTVTLDETRPETEDTAGGTSPNGDASATIDFSLNFVTGGSVDYGADGPGSVTYALDLNGTDVPSGLYALDNTDTSIVDTDGYGQGDEIVLNQVGNTITGSVGLVDYFTITIDPATGIVTFTQLNNIWHPIAGSTAAALDDMATLNTLTADLIQVIQTVTDFDGDTDTASINIGRGVFQIQDDGPEILEFTDAVGENTGATPTAEGIFDFDIGTDSPNGDNDDIYIDPDTFVVSINGNPVDPADVTFTDEGEDADFANYSFEFDYDTGSGGTATATGTLVFNKADGTYTVTLTSGPIEGFSILATGTADASAFVSYQSAANPTGSPEITVAALDTDFFVQFTGIAEPSSGTGANNLFTTQGATGEFNPVTTATFTGLELFTQAEGSVTVSSTAAGVAGNTIQGGEVLDFNLYSADPGATLGVAPTADATEMFIVLDGIGTSEDMIIILKLYDTVTGEYTTKALMVQNADIIKSNATLAGTAYEGIVLDNNDGIVVIQANDYQQGNTNLVIVGGQIAGSDEGIIGTALSFNGAMGPGGGDVGATQAFSTDVSDAPFKITSIGFLTESSEDQSLEIGFDVTITDADGDSQTTSLTATIGDPPAEPLTASTMMISQESVEDTSSFSLMASDTDLRSMSAANNNNVLVAAIAAAGLGASSAAAANDHAPSGRSAGMEAQLVADGGGSVQSIDAASDDVSRSTLSGETREAVDVQAQDGSSASHADEAAANTLTEGDSHASQAVAPLLEGTDASDQSAPAQTSFTSAAVGMPSAEMLAAANANDNALEGQAQSAGEVGRVLFDALAGGGHGPNLDAIIDAAANQAHGSGQAIEALASHGPADVSGWDMASIADFTGAHAAFTMDHMTLQPDAAPTV